MPKDSGHSQLLSCRQNLKDGRTASLPENSWPFLKWDSLPLRALVIRSQPVSVSLSSPPLTLLLSSYETFPPGEGIVFQIFLPW